MKFKISYLFLFAFIALFLSCNPDDDPDQKAELTETLPIAKEKVLDNLIVEGATKKAGAPNTPNKQVSFTLDKKNTSAVMVDGFDIMFKSNDNIIGAYLQIKDTDGNVADGYYDIDLSKVGKKKQAVKNKKNLKSINHLFKSKQTAQKKADGEDDIVVDVDFNTTLEAGTFCYLVCVYDAEGNISAPQEVCITIQSWGGNDDLAGVWNYTKEDVFEDGEIETTNVGEEDCYENELHCENQSIITYSNCYSTDDFKFTINSDGTYIYEVHDTSKSIDYEASRTSCELVEQTRQDSYISKGNWAYDQSKGEIIIVELEATETNEEGIEETETYNTGDAEFIIFKSTVNSNDLILTEEYLDADDNVVEYFKYYFEK